MLLFLKQPYSPEQCAHDEHDMRPKTLFLLRVHGAVKKLTFS